MRTRARPDIGRTAGLARSAFLHSLPIPWNPACLLVAILLLSGLAPRSARAAEESAVFGRFGTVTLYHGTAAPAHVVLFVSGDGGWNQGVIDMARELVGLDALVVGIDITHYLAQLEAGTEACSYPASDFEELSKFVQKKLGYPDYRIPVLVGYSSGATLVYAILVQAPSNTFLGALSLGFCPDLPLAKPFCAGNGLEGDPGPKGKGIVFRPAKKLEAPWIALQGTIDQVCDPAATEAFVKQTVNSRIVILPKVGHGYSVPKNWMPQFRDAFGQIANAGPVDRPATETGDLSDLPLIEVPAADDTAADPAGDTAGGASGNSGRDLLVVHLTGDGGWGMTDKGLGKELAASGIPVVGWNSLQYFWHARTPDGTAADLARILRHYLDAWHKSRAVLVGYSFGADVLPILVNRLPADLLAHIPAIVLLGPSADATFQFHLTDWIGTRDLKDALPVIPEIQRIQGPRIFCFYGERDREAICKELDPARVTSFSLGGGHRIGDRFDEIVRTILTEVN